MHSIKLDFNKTNRHWKRMWRWIGIVLFVIGFALISFLIILQKHYESDQANLSAQVTALHQPRKIAPRALEKMQSVESKTANRQINEVTRLLNLPWPSLFKTLEDSRGADIDLISITPNSETGEIQLVGQATNLKATFKFIENLKKDSHFKAVELNEYQSIVYNNSPALRFTMSADWLGVHE